MNNILYKLIMHEADSITDEDICSALEEMCDKVHASCDRECIIFDFCGEVPLVGEPPNCVCFKNGKEMLSLLREEIE